MLGSRGSIVFTHGAWYHTARPNITTQSRTVLLGMYLKPCFVPQEDMHGQLAQIEDPSELLQKIMGGTQHNLRNVGAKNNNPSYLHTPIRQSLFWQYKLRLSSEVLYSILAIQLVKMNGYVLFEAILPPPLICRLTPSIY